MQNLSLFFRQLLANIGHARLRFTILLSSLLVVTMIALGARMIEASPIVTLSLSPSHDPIIEGDSPDTKVVNFVVRLSSTVGTGQQVVITMSALSSATDPATPDADYSAAPETLTFTAGESQKVYPVTILGDDTDEVNEAFIVRATITSSTIGGIQPPVGTIIDTYAVIYDDDNPTVDSISEPTAHEDDGTIDFVVTLNQPSAVEDISIAYRTVNQTAQDVSDFTGTSLGFLVIPQGQTTGTIKIPLVNDAINESDESFTLELLPDKSLNVNAPFTQTTANGTIIDDNDVPTAETPQEFSVDENFTGLVGVIVAQDQESDPLTYTATGAAPFEVNLNTGQITLATGLDYETDARTYSFDVTISDGADDITITVNITLNNVDESAEIESPQTFSIDENSTTLNSPNQIVASDPEGGTLSYSINDPGSTLFAVDPDTGAISYIGATPLDYETDTRTYTFDVTVSDGTPANDVTVTVNITLNDVNEPVKANTPQAFSIDENATGSLGSIVATDPENGPLSYTATEAAPFAVNPTTGEITLATGQNYETFTPNPYSFTVVVSDGTPANDATVTVNITINNVDEPVKAETPQGFDIDENATGSLGSIAATDPEGSALSYTATGSAPFVVNPTTGEITLATALDYETDTRTYSFTVTVSEGTPANDATVTVNITLNDVNEPVEADTPQAFSIDENAIGSLGTIAATDPDAGTTLSYTATGATPFAVNPTTGEITLGPDALDYERDQRTYSFDVVISDGTPANNATVRVNITLNDVNEPPYADSPQTFEISEDATGNIAAISAVDPENQPLTFTAIPPTGPFTVNTSTGAISTTGLDFETITPNPYIFDVEITDGTTGNEITVSVRITIKDVNERPVVYPDGADTNGTANYTERATATQIATALTLTDPEAGAVTNPENGNITTVVVQINSPLDGTGEVLDVSAASGITESYDPATGILTLTANPPVTSAAMQTVLRTLTYANASYNPTSVRIVRITATDGGTPPLSNNPVAEIEITIQPLLDAPTLTNKGMEVSEGGTKTILTSELSASDPDTTAANLIFTITNAVDNGTLYRGTTPLGVNSTFTQADLDSGLISYTHNDSETSSDSFTFNLTDGANPTTGHIFTITIIGQNDPPVLTTSLGTTAYTIANPPVQIDSAATVTDPDPTTTDFANGGLQVSLASATSTTGDTLSVRNVGLGSITVVGSNIYYNGNQIGIMSGGTGTDPLLISFTGFSPSVAAVQALVQNITFANNTPTTSLSRTVTFIVDDGDGDTSAPQTKQISINNRPVAVNDAVTMTFNTSQTVPVLANDSDPENHTLSITGVTNGAHGTVVIEGTSVRYTPNLNYVGSDSFTYTISDGNGGTATGTVQVTVRLHTVFLPLVVRSAFADLAVDFTFTPTNPKANVPTTSIAVTVTNNGEVAASNFWVDFYIQPSRAPQVNEPWYELCSLDPCFGLAWYYTGTLAPGQSVVLNSNPQSPTNPNGFNVNATDWRGYFAPGTQQLYAYVDSWNRDAGGGSRDVNGAVLESNESNNRTQKSVVLAPNAQALPLQSELQPNRIFTRP